MYVQARLDFESTHILAHARTHTCTYTCMHARTQLERLIAKNYYLHKSARDGYRSYLQAYASHSLKTVFNVELLDLQRVAKSFGFSNPPSVSLSILMAGREGGREGGRGRGRERGERERKKERKGGEGGKKEREKRERRKERGGGEDELTMEIPQPTFLCLVKPTVQL